MSSLSLLRPLTSVRDHRRIMDLDISGVGRWRAGAYGMMRGSFRKGPFGLIGASRVLTGWLFLFCRTDGALSNMGLNVGLNMGVSAGQTWVFSISKAGEKAGEKAGLNVGLNMGVSATNSCSAAKTIRQETNIKTASLILRLCARKSLPDPGAHSRSPFRSLRDHASIL